VHQLYMAGAISFEADRDVVVLMGGLDDEATLYHDKNYDLRAGVSVSVPGGPKEISDRADTVWSVKYIDADRVWNELGYTGDGVVVGHIDSGIYLTHPDLSNQLWVNTGEIPNNGIDDDENGYVDDVNGWDFGDDDNNPNDDAAGAGHGTHTAGTVVGDGSNGTLTGVAPGARLIACKAFDNAGTGSLGMMWAAEQYCVENGARVITMSLGVKGEIPAQYLRNERINCANIRDAGVVLFNSAGNEHYEYNPPIECGMTARVPAPWVGADVAFSNTGGVVSVGGTGYQNNTVYGSSSRGPAKWNDVDPYNDWPYQPGDGLIKPDIAAPGVGVNSTTIPAGYSGNTWNGTSMACPHAAGVAALMLEKNPSLSPAGVDSLLEITALDLGIGGKDNTFGAGLINAYDAVTATPLVQTADLVFKEILPDAGGDEVLDPGGLSEMAFLFQNVSTVADAIGVTGTLAVVANPYVTVVDGEGAFPDIAKLGGWGDNAGDPFILAVDEAAPQGYEFTMLLTISSGAEFSRTFDLPWYVGLPDWRTHTIGDIFLTVTDQGIIGYMDQSHTEGDGMGPHDGGTGLYVGSFWVGNGLDYVCNRDFSGDGADLYEWVKSEDPNGRVRDLGAAASDETFRAIFTDGGHPDPKPLSVEQTSFAFSGAGNNEFVVLEYKVTNHGPTSLTNFHTAVFCDFDIGDSGANEGGTDPARNLTYLYASGGPYYGITLLGEDNARNLTLVNNPQYVYPELHIDDGIKIRLMNGQISVPNSSAVGPDDWSAVTSYSISLGGNGGSETVVYALVYGESLAELQANADAAHAAYSPLAEVTPENPVKLFRLGQNHPNPFNPQTSIKYTVAHEGHVELAVYSLNGRRVRTLVSETRTVGEHRVVWDGTDANGLKVPSGMYFYKMSSGGETSTRKMTLVK